MNNLMVFLLNQQKLLESFETLMVSEGSQNFVNNQLILYHLRQISHLSLKDREVSGELTTASYEIKKKLFEIGRISVLSKKGEYSIVEHYDSLPAREKS